MFSEIFENVGLVGVLFIENVGLVGVLWFVLLWLVTVFILNMWRNILDSAIVKIQKDNEKSINKILDVLDNYHRLAVDRHDSFVDIHNGFVDDFNYQLETEEHEALIMDMEQKARNKRSRAQYRYRKSFFR